MNITNAKFTEDGSITATVNGAQMVIPDDPGNRHRAAMIEQGVTPTPYVAPPAFATYDEAAAAMVAWIDGLTAQIEGQYPSVVRKGWIEEEAMASAYMAGTADDDQLAELTADATAKNRTPEEHAMRILANGEAFRSIAKQVRNLWLATDARLQAVTDPFEYAAILAWAAEQAAPLAKAAGLSADV